MSPILCLSFSLTSQLLCEKITLIINFILTGYLSNEKRISEAFVGDFYLTGDRVYSDDDGYFWFVGRADDVIISAGYVRS